jgi:hypothetical protein
MRFDSRCRLLEAQRWLGSHLPYWDRNGGRDHIVVSNTADAWHQHLITNLAQYE